MIRKLKTLFVHAMLAVVTLTGFTQSVQAAMMGTEQMHTASLAQQNRDKIEAALSRPQVLSQLETLGVPSEDAKARVAALTDAEAAQLAGRIDSLPAGGDSVVGAIVLIFFVLLVTDWLGLTKIFPFTRTQR